MPGTGSFKANRFSIIYQRLKGYFDSFNHIPLLKN